MPTRRVWRYKARVAPLTARGMGVLSRQGSGRVRAPVRNGRRAVFLAVLRRWMARLLRGAYGRDRRGVAAGLDGARKGVCDDILLRARNGA
jgi:hypothetical protein